jgi:protein O-mannosyl-transferase
MTRRATSRQTSVNARARQSTASEMSSGLFGSGRTTASILWLLLVAGTVAGYGPAIGHPFVVLDDHDYVTGNVHVHGGLSWNTVRWAFTSIEAANWHPLTWLSHALDYQLFGLDAAGHHFDSVLLHALNAGLLFLLLRRASGRWGPSFLVAALFAVHPLNVESVAWIAERKNVLCTFFFLAALGAYGWYAQKPDWRRYLAVAALFMLALMSKPMAVTLPFTLLLLDYWPLRRMIGSPASTTGAPQTSFGRLLLEKIPLLLLSAASAAITIKAQHASYAVRSLGQFSLGARIQNAVVSYGLYLWKMVWPARLAAFYPYPVTTPVWQLMAAMLVLAGGTALAFVFRRQRYLLVGWLWFLGTLVPVIGLVQVGDAAMADRYAYIPLIGIFVMVAFGLADAAEAKKIPIAWQIVPALCALTALGVVMERQGGYWASEYDLWAHTLAVTESNPFAHDAIASALLDPAAAMSPADLEEFDSDEKRAEAARQHYEQALKIRGELAQKNPAAYLADIAMTLNNLGNLDRQQNRMDEARRHYEEALSIHRRLVAQDADPYLADMAMALNNLGFLERVEKQTDAAHQHFAEALEIYRRLAPQRPVIILPDVALTLNNLAITERDEHQPEEARQHYEEALQIRRGLAQQVPAQYLPDLGMTLNDLGSLNIEQQQLGAARQHYEEAAQIYRQLARQDPANYEAYLAGTLNNLGFLDKNQNHSNEAREHYQEALSIYLELSRTDSDRYARDVARVQAGLKELGEAVSR